MVIRKNYVIVAHVLSFENRTKIEILKSHIMALALLVLVLLIRDSKISTPASGSHSV